MSQPPGPLAAHEQRSTAPAPPGRPRRRPWGLLPSLLAATALLAGCAWLLVVLLGDQGDEPSLVAGLGATASVEPGPPATGSAPPAAESAADADGGRFERSGETARRWVDAMAAGDFQSAFNLSCAEVQDAATAGAPDGDAADSLGDYFSEQVLGGVGVTTVALDGVRYDAASGTDVVSFTLTTDDGGPIPLLVYVISDGTVCDFR